MYAVHKELGSTITLGAEVLLVTIATKKGLAKTINYHFIHFE
jgi:hypothetical protein